MRSFAYISLALALLMGSNALAQQAKPAAPLTLQQCIDLAMRDQTDVIVARNNVLVAKARTADALSNYLPQLSIQNNAFHWGSQSVLSKVTNGTALSVNQNIFDGGLREANMTNARYGVVQNKAGLTRTVQTTTYSVSKAYYEVLRSKHLAEVADASVKYNEGLKAQVEERAKQGDVAKVDVLPVEAQLANARVSLLSAQNAVRTASLTLQSTIGLSPRRGFDVADMDVTPSVEVKPLESYVNTAVAVRPDILQSKAGTGAARASLKAARLNLYPRPLISGTYQREIQGGFTSSSGQVVGGFVFDIFNGGANRAAYRAAQANRANAAQQEVQVNRDIQTQVEEAYLNLTDAKERLAATEVGLTAAQANYDVQKDRYSQGLATTLDLLNAEVQLITAQSNSVQARYDYYIAIAQMDFSVGKQGGFNAS